MKISFLEIEDWERSFLTTSLNGHQLDFYSEHINEKNLKSLTETEILSIFIYSNLNSDVIDKMPNLKLIVTRSMGFDHIDLKYCKKKGITVCNVPTYGGNTVAEHAFALILNISRNIVSSVERTRKGNFEVDNLRGFDLYGKTIGVVGIGHIGKEVIRIAHGFGMKVLVFARHPSEELARKLKVSFHSLNELLRLSDIVSFHVPHTKETHHMINKRNVGKFKKGSILINTARGGLIQTEAILYGLEKGVFKAVGLDVLEEECGIKEETELLTGRFIETCDLKTQLFNHVLLNKENVYITPHNAFNSNEALDTILHVTKDNILGYIDRTPVNMVNI